MGAEQGSGRARVDGMLVVDVAAPIATITLNRPEARNALSRELLGLLRRAFSELDGREDVRAVVLTGTDPAFCAGLDLKELGKDTSILSSRPSRSRAGSAASSGGSPGFTSADRPIAKPLIGAVNGPAATGGLELALHCDFLIASENAAFADTHALVGVQPAWGLTVLLPEAVGLRRAREMSATGRFIDAQTALAWGLVNRVVAHESLLDTARAIAEDIAAVDEGALRALWATYDDAARQRRAAAWDIEAAAASAWQGNGLDPAIIERRRAAILARAASASGTAPR